MYGLYKKINLKYPAWWIEKGGMDVFADIAANMVGRREESPIPLCLNVVYLIHYGVLTLFLCCRSVFAAGAKPTEKVRVCK